MIRARSVVTWPGVSRNVVNVASTARHRGLTHDDAVLLQLDHHQASPGGGHHDRRPRQPDVGSLAADTDTAGAGGVGAAVVTASDVHGPTWSPFCTTAARTV